jgi:hypothetical protein
VPRHGLEQFNGTGHRERRHEAVGGLLAVAVLPALAGITGVAYLHRMRSPPLTTIASQATTTSLGAEE